MTFSLHDNQWQISQSVQASICWISGTVVDTDMCLVPKRPQDATLYSTSIHLWGLNSMHFELLRKDLFLGSHLGFWGRHLGFSCVQRCVFKEWSLKRMCPNHTTWATVCCAVVTRWPPGDLQGGPLIIDRVLAVLAVSAVSAVSAPPAQRRRHVNEPDCSRFYRLSHSISLFWLGFLKPDHDAWYWSVWPVLILLVDFL